MTVPNDLHNWARAASRWHGPATGVLAVALLFSACARNADTSLESAGPSLSPSVGPTIGGSSAPSPAKPNEPTTAMPKGGDAPPIAQCEDRAVGETFCAAGAVRSCMDRGFEDKPCGERSVCRLEGGSASCACAAGFKDTASGCADVDECAVDNGGCDVETPCKNMPGGYTCGGCPVGYLGGKNGVCAPALIDLAVSPGTLDPAFSPMQKQYSVVIPLTASTIDITMTAPQEATLTVNGTPAKSGTAWRSESLPLGDTMFEIVVARPEFPSTTYGLLVTRGEGQEGYLKPDATRSGASFGGSLALSGNVLVVGAPAADASVMASEDARATTVLDSGAAYVFERQGKRWVQRAVLQADVPAANAEFGTMVAIASDTIVIGAPGVAFTPPQPEPETPAAAPAEGEMAPRAPAAPAPAAQAGAGAVYVFVRAGEGWKQQALLRASNADAGDAFGTVLAISGNTVVVGAAREGSDAVGVGADGDNDAAPGNGAAYVFVREKDTWTQQAFLKAPVSAPGQGFGFSVAIDRDTLAVGAVRGVARFEMLAEPAAAESPEVPATPDEPATPPAEAADQAETPAAAPQTPAPAPRAPAGELIPAGTGTVYVFTRDGAVWTQTGELKPADTGTAGWFGYHVAISGKTLVVGAPGESVEVQIPASSPPAVAPAAGQAQDEAAADAAMAPAAPAEPTTRRVASGAAHVFVLGRRGWSEQALLSPTQDPALALGTARDGFGASVKIVGDTALIGAFGEDSNAAGINGDQTNASSPNSGAAYLFMRSGKAWGEPVYVKASNTRANDEFGRHTALSSEGFAVGAASEDSGARGTDGNQADASARDSGAVYVFR